MVVRTILLVGGGAVVGAVLAPLALSAVGFGAAGVTARSIAASIQTPTTDAGSWFANAKSAGATGAVTGIGAGVGAVGSALLRCKVPSYGF